MKTHNHFVISFYDLKVEKQAEIKENLRERLIEANKEYLFQVCGSDPYDMDKPDSDRISDHVEGVVERGCDGSWVEMEVVINL